MGSASREGSFTSRASSNGSLRRDTRHDLCVYGSRVQAAEMETGSFLRRIGCFHRLSDCGVVVPKELCLVSAHVVEYIGIERRSYRWTHWVLVCWKRIEGIEGVSMGSGECETDGVGLGKAA